MLINTKPKTPHITAKERLVRPLRFKGSLLYSQETVPKAISCTQEQTYSNKAPTTALTKKMMKLLECLNWYITKVKSTAPKPKPGKKDRRSSLAGFQKKPRSDSTRAFPPDSQSRKTTRNIQKQLVEAGQARGEAGGRRRALGFWRGMQRLAYFCFS